MVLAAARVLEEREREGSLRVDVQRLVRWLVTVVRQSTTVPKTSVRRALGGLVRDIVYWGVEEGKEMS